MPAAGRSAQSAPSPSLDVRRRRRGKLLEHTLLNAAWAELQSVGYQALSMDAVATKAGTSKAVLYRRWPNRAVLVLAALRQHRPMLSGPPPDTGSLRDDVLTLLRRMSAGLAEVGPETVFGLLDELFADPEGRAYLHAQQAANVAMRAILEAASERGDVDLNGLTPRVAALPVDLARHELLVRRALVPDKVIIEIVDNIFLPLVRTLSRSGAHYQVQSHDTGTRAPLHPIGTG
jgi:AcrR family transcriptional regulator